jgi:hypothetical protein
MQGSGDLKQSGDHLNKKRTLHYIYEREFRNRVGLEELQKDIIWRIPFNDVENNNSPDPSLKLIPFVQLTKIKKN